MPHMRFRMHSEEHIHISTHRHISMLMDVLCLNCALGVPCDCFSCLSVAFRGSLLTPLSDMVTSPIQLGGKGAEEDTWHWGCRGCVQGVHEWVRVWVHCLCSQAGMLNMAVQTV